MSPTQLNPDAWRQGLGVFKRSYYDDDDSRAKCFENGLRAYFAAVHPVVNSVEELEALPAGTLVKSGGREFYKTSYVELPWILPYGVDRFGSSYLAKHSKVTVIHRPEVNS